MSMHLVLTIATSRNHGVAIDYACPDPIALNKQIRQLHQKLGLANLKYTNTYALTHENFIQLKSHDHRLKNYQLCHDFDEFQRHLPDAKIYYNSIQDLRDPGMKFDV